MSTDMVDFSEFGNFIMPFSSKSGGSWGVRDRVQVMISFHVLL